jgi:hypothetical protein
MLYEKYNQIQEEIDKIKKAERERLKQLVDEPYGENIEKNLNALFEKATADEIQETKIAIDRIQNGQNWYGDPFDLELVRFREVAIPIVYQAIKEGRLSGFRAWHILQYYPTEKVLPVYHILLLDSARSGNHFFQRDILRLLESIPPNKQNLETIKIIAEFTRHSAEMALAAKDDEEKALNFRANVKMGLATLFRFNFEEAKKLRNILAFSYPELNTGYESLSVPKLEKPKTKEQREWSHAKMYIRGSALFAEILDRGKEKVHDLDIFITTPDFVANTEVTKVGCFENISDLENIFDPGEFKKLKNWAEERDYSKKKVNLVRIPESHLQLEETFEGEPKLLLWDRVLEGKEIEVDRYTPEDLKNYKEGKYVINPNFPKRLVANGTLTRALRTMDLAGRLNLEYDETILNSAEQAARKSELIISDIPVTRLIDRHELSPTVVLDPTFIKVFEDKKLRKPLLKKYPRLGQLAEEIAKAGGAGNWIRKKYGEVYLKTKGYVRLYDINLSKSSADPYRQQRFIEEWYGELRSRNFGLASVEKISEETDLSQPKDLDDYIDVYRLERGIEQRKNKNAFLDKIAGEYKVTIEVATDSYELRKKIDAFLSVMNINWPTNMDMDKKSVSQTLIQLGVHPKNPILKQFDSATKHEVALVISKKPEDILSASFDKPWISCIRLDGGEYRDGLYEDVGNATVIAYFLKDKKFVSRILIRAGITLDKFEYAAAIEKLYGDDRYREAMHDALKKVITESGIKTETPMMTYPFRDAYFDSDTCDTSLEGNHYYYTIDK